ncbi:hypothetical protein GTA08_BOTSDO01272 [Botryosphaeria dothidea]|uniref:Uncharacterized protein n=1 Tax=Botryosphaeria dothidea TaxID=55169 RepID=A0A8H4J8Y2_9PEZI|nr:hypothetical protein GTA08_BOTSDO01272 [Botryosphaeria dothidea]
MYKSFGSFDATLKCHECFTAHDGTHQVITVYQAGRWKIRKPFAFQVYVTFDTSSYTDTELEDVVDTHSTIKEVVSVCTAHYRAAQTACARDKARRLVSSYGETVEGFAGFLVTVRSPDWKVKTGLGFLYFDETQKGSAPRDHHFFLPTDSPQSPTTLDAWRHRIQKAYDGMQYELWKEWVEEYNLVVEWADKRDRYEFEIALAEGSTTQEGT